MTIAEAVALQLHLLGLSDQDLAYLPLHVQHRILKAKPGGRWIPPDLKLNLLSGQKLNPGPRLVVHSPYFRDRHLHWNGPCLIDFDYWTDVYDDLRRKGVKLPFDTDFEPAPDLIHREASKAGSALGAVNEVAHGEIDEGGTLVETQVEGSVMSKAKEVVGIFKTALTMLCAG